MRTIDFAIMTVARSPVYIHELIASLRSDLPLRLIAGSPDYEYLERYRDNPAREIIEVPAKGWEHFQNRSVSHRANWNYWRCLTLGPRTSSCEGLLIFEDDVVPAEHSLRFANALSKQGVPFELHIYARGMHGQGLAEDDPYLATWFALCCHWLTAMAWPI